MSRTYTKEDCISALQKAADTLGKSPTREEYSELDIYPTHSTIYDICGTWNNAKKEAGLEEYSPGRQHSKKPKLVEMDNDEWLSLSPSKRHRIRKRTRLQRIKLIEGCQNCDFDKHPSALEFHHIDRFTKSFEITSGYVSGNKNWDEVKKEIKKCEVLCSNCHKIEESELRYTQ